MPLTQYLKTLAGKITKLEQTTDKQSLMALSRDFYQQSSMKNVEYIDTKASLILTLLNIKMLALSQGKYGLGELLI